MRTENKIQQILRDFLNESLKNNLGDEFFPHAGFDDNCGLCSIERKYVEKIKRLFKEEK